MKTPVQNLSKSVVIALCFLGSFQLQNAEAALNYWDPQGTTGGIPYTGNMTGNWEDASWSTATNGLATPINWSDAGVAAAIGTHTSNTTPAFTITVNANHTVNGIFNSQGTGNSACMVTITGPGIFNIGTGNQGFSTSSGGNTILGVTLTNAGILTAEGSGQLWLNASNGYTGGTSLGFSGLTTFTGVLNYNNSNSFGTGTIIMSNTGTANGICALVEETGTNGVVIPNAWKNTLTNGGVNLAIADAGAAVTFTGNWNNASNLNVGTGAADQNNIVTLSGVISGAGAVNKFNHNTLRLSGANTYSGNTSVSNGVLQLGANGGIPSGSSKGNVTVFSAGGTTNTLLDINGFSASVNGLSGNATIDNTSPNQGTLTLGNNNASSTYTGTIQSTGGQFNITKAGTGTFTLNSPGLGYSGNTTVNAGSFILTNGTTLPNSTALTVAAGAKLDVVSTSQTIAALSGGGLITNNTGSITLSGNTNGTNFPSYSCFLGTIDQGSLTKQGNGVMSIHNTNLNNIAFTYSGGVLSVGAITNALPTTFGLSVPSGGLFQLDGSGQTVSSLNGSGAINLGGGTLTINATGGSLYSGTIQNSELITNSTAAGHGLRGYYYDGVDFSALDTVRDDPNINFNFTNAGALPNPPNHTNFISVRWIGQVLTTVAGTYKFSGTSDDGQRLWVNGTNILDNWVSRSAATNSGNITLAANTRYDIVYEYMNITGPSVAILAWTPPGDSVSTVIPTDFLFLPGAGNLVIGGTSQVSLQASNNYTGGTTVLGGAALEGSGDATLGKGNVTVNNGGVLTLDNGTANTYISSGADLVINSTSPTLSLNYTGTDNIHAFSTNGGTSYATAGTYGSSTSSAAHKIPQIIGSGILNVTGVPVGSITLTSGGPSVYGSSINFTSTVTGGSGTPTGTITFYDGATAIGMASLSSGQAVLTVSDLSAVTSPHSITAVYSGDATYIKATSSVLSQTVSTLSIAPATLSVSNKVYDGTATASLIASNLTVTGVLPGDTNSVRIASGTAVFSDKNIGTNKNVTISGLTLGGSLAGNYSLVPNSGSTTANISIAPMSITNITVDTRPYDTTVTAPLNNGSATLVTVLGTDSVTLNTGSASGNYTTATPGTNKAVTALGYALAGNDASNYNLTQPTGLVGIVTNAATANVVVVSPANPAPGQVVTFTSTITAVPPGAGTPTGSVTFLTNGVLFNLVSLTNGVTAIGTSNLFANATNTVIAGYGGDLNFFASSTTNTFFIGNASPGLLTIAKVGTNIVLNWSNSFTLQQSTIVSNTNSGFADVPGPVTSGPYTNTNTATKLFFRLRN